MVERLIRRAKLAVGRSEVVRRVYGRRQQAHVDSVLSRGAAGGMVWSAEALAHRIDELRGQRVELPARPTVVAFGYEDWERHGLWPSLARVSDLHLVPIARLNETHALPKEGPGRLAPLLRAYLAEVDRLMAAGPVHLVFFYVDAGMLPPGLLEELARRRVWSVVMGLDDKHQFLPRHRRGLVIRQDELASKVDLYWTTWRAGCDVIAGDGGRPWYAPEAADPAFHHPVDVPRDLDVLFLGQRYGRRAALVEHLRARGIKVSCFGRGWEGGHVSFEQSVELFSRAKVVLGVGDTGMMTGLQALKGRDFEAPMCGAVYLTSFNPELADWWHVGREILCWSTFENCFETLSWILPRTDVQESIRAAALERARREHTWEARWFGLFGLLRD